MRNIEINLAHGEVDVSFEMAEKTVESGWGSTYFQQKMFVTMVDCFDDITLEVTAVITGDLYPEWDFRTAKFFSAGITNEMTAGSAELEEAMISGEEMAKELIDNHEFLDGLTQAFYR